jgi:hypothetical protein
VRWFASVIPAFWKLRQEDWELERSLSEFQVCLSDIMRLFLKNKNKNKNKQYIDPQHHTQKKKKEKKRPSDHTSIF